MSINQIGIPASVAATGAAAANGTGAVAGGPAAPSAYATLANIVQQRNASTDVATLAATTAGAVAGTATPGAFGKFVADARAAGTQLRHGGHHGGHHGSGKSGATGVTDTSANSTASFLNWLAASNTSTTPAADGTPTLLDVSA